MGAGASRFQYLNGLIDVLNRNFSLTTWASFNWDCIFDASFYYNSGPPEAYARYNPSLVIKLEGWKRGTTKHEYLKLHGSVNWWLVGGTPTALSWGSYGELTKKWDELAQGKTEDRPIILEPSAYKYEDELYEKILITQWQHFVYKLVDADCVLIIGYSLPDNDLEARCKMVTAFQVNAKCLWGVIDLGDESRRKYQRLFGSKRLQTLDTSLAGFGANLIDNLRNLFPGIDINPPGTPAGRPAP